MFNNREKKLITAALYILECQIMADELHYELESELVSISDKEVRDLMEKIDGEN